LSLSSICRVACNAIHTRWIVSFYNNKLDISQIPWGSVPCTTCSSSPPHYQRLESESGYCKIPHPKRKEIVVMMARSIVNVKETNLKLLDLGRILGE
jgi:hypothetical protein